MKKFLNENIAGILNIMLKSPAFKNYKFTNKPDLERDAQISRRAASEGMVLLKNDNNALPIKSTVNIALFGNHGYELIAGGTGSGSVNKAYTVTLDQGLANAGFNVKGELKNAYTDYIKEYRMKNPVKGNHRRIYASFTTDARICIYGRSSYKTSREYRYRSHRDRQECGRRSRQESGK